MSHAKLSPSSAERWIVCPGSVVLSEGMPERTSAFAEEGTQAHALAEMLLTMTPGEMDTPAGMLDNVMVYVDHIRGILAEHPDAVLMVEQRVKVNDLVYGTADAVIWIPSLQLLIIVDLKYGAGVAVEAISLQLKIYALAALLTFGYKAKRVSATIVQPRCPHTDGPIRTAVYETADLIDFHADLEDAVARVTAASLIYKGGELAKAKAWFDEEHLTPSDKGCKWCLAAPKCPALKSKAQEVAKKVFAPGLPYDPKELAEVLEFLPILEGWAKNTREFAYGEAEKGHAIPNWKLVEKRASRKWRDETAAASALNAAGVDCWEKKLITPAVAEKALLKEQRGLLDELTVKESSGHTLVHESDKRPAIKVDAASAFANI